MNDNLASRPIVVGFDGSESALDAARWAADEADRRRLPVRLVSVVQFAAPNYAGAVMVDADLTEEMKTEALTQLSKTTTALQADHPELDIDFTIRVGLPVGTLAEESAKASLMVLGSRGLGGFSGILAGSTSAGLVTHGHCPVVVVRGTPQDGPVVVGVDGSDAGAAAVAQAFEEASLRSTELVALHAWTDYGSDLAYAAAHQFVVDWGVVERRQREMLTKSLSGWQEKFPDVVVRQVVVRDRPVRALLDAAAHAQLLVVGSRGHGGLAGMLLGSTSQALVYHAPCPLLVARSAS